MAADDQPRGLRTNRGALLRYAVAWIAVGISAAALALVLVRSTHHHSRGAKSDPITAVVASGCVLEQLRGRQARMARPPVSGPRARAAADGVYSSPQPKRRLVGALRRGVVVVQYQPRMGSATVDAIRKAFAPSEPRRIVVPDATSMTFAVAATGWRRVLGCSKVNAQVLRALREFAHRYGGAGPDS